MEDYEDYEDEMEEEPMGEDDDYLESLKAEEAAAERKAEAAAVAAAEAKRDAEEKAKREAEAAAAAEAEAEAAARPNSGGGARPPRPKHDPAVRRARSRPADAATHATPATLPPPHEARAASPGRLVTALSLIHI